MNLGIGVMIQRLYGDTNGDGAEKYYGRKIVAAKLDDDKDWGQRFRLNFDDGTSVSIYDGGQSCCEYRYITTDDDVSNIVGNVLLKIEVKEGPTKDHDYDVHETAFVEIQTDRGFMTLTTHNEHNGYYGGFALSIMEDKA